MSYRGQLGQPVQKHVINTKSIESTKTLFLLSLFVLLLTAQRLIAASRGLRQLLNVATQWATELFKKQVLSMEFTSFLFSFLYSLSSLHPVFSVYILSMQFTSFLFSLHSLYVVYILSIQFIFFLYSLNPFYLVYMLFI